MTKPTDIDTRRKRQKLNEEALGACMTVNPSKNYFLFLVTMFFAISAISIVVGLIEAVL